LTAGGGRELVFVGDVHLDRDDEALAPFLAFLRGLQSTAECVVLMGDLFQLWLGDRALEQPHQTAVLDGLRGLRSAGVRVRYLEGNRDFHLARAYAGDALDDAGDAGIEERCGGRRVFAVHGDLTNPADRQYRTWRRVARSRLAWAALSALPAGRRGALAASLERRMRGSNADFKGRFPEAAVRAYGDGFLARGYDAVVLGHFHVERELASGTRPGGRIFVLPEWKGSRRHLRVTAAGAIAFVDSESSVSR
jgi:UDP-2,3-diacylglucosamine hydrolase